MKGKKKGLLVPVSGLYLTNCVFNAYVTAIYQCSTVQSARSELTRFRSTIFE